MRTEYCANLSDSLPNLDSLPQHCGVLSWLLGDSDSAYFNKNMYHFLAIQTCICMQGIDLAAAVGQWCWASCTGWALMKFKCLWWCSELKRVDVTLIVFWPVNTCRNGWAPLTLSCFNSCAHSQKAGMPETCSLLCKLTFHNDINWEWCPEEFYSEVCKVQLQLNLDIDQGCFVAFPVIGL